jgi:hypothetical protein
VEALAGFILKVVAPSEAPLTAPPPKLGPTAEALPEHLSEEELTALLSDKLKETADTADVAMVPIRNRG